MPNLLVQITDEQAAWLDSRCDRLNPKSRLIRDLIDSARFKVDNPATLGAESSEAPSKAVSTSNKSTSKEHKNKALKSRKSTKATPEFEAFWKAYQSSPRKANCQSKAKAWEVWKELTPDVDPSDLLRAAQAAVKECQDLISSGEFCAPLPDCFRWLRDERYAVLLENHIADSSPSYRW